MLLQSIDTASPLFVGHTVSHDFAPNEDDGTCTDPFSFARLRRVQSFAIVLLMLLAVRAASGIASLFEHLRNSIKLVERLIHSVSACNRTVLQRQQ